ncbi:hypothetical protein IMZ48_23170, partial [Candidatus Bathyarchaeota archaeon]|nr:hypothetical protein [Candidatus Bathyarchaeota archaeon]
MAPILTGIAAPKETNAPSKDDNKDEEDSGEKKNGDSLNTAKTLDPDAKPTGKDDNDDDDDKDDKKNKNGTKTKEEFDFTDPPGAATFITPNVFMGQALYKA